MKTLWIAGLLLAATLMAGCSGTSSAKLEVSHSESSERTRIVVESIPSQPIRYSELTVEIQGKAFAFGEFLSLQERRYQVDGKKDATALLEAQDVITAPAAGLIKVRLLKGSEALAEFEANVPDNKAPAAPVIVEPSASAEGVSATPTFRWSSVMDASGTRYMLVYSLDPSFTIVPLTKNVDMLTVASYQIPAGQELLGGQTYYWRVQAKDGFENASPWSQVGSFKVAG
jgi:hypothetical protein